MKRQEPHIVLVWQMKHGFIQWHDDDKCFLLFTFPNDFWLSIWFLFSSVFFLTSYVEVEFCRIVLWNYLFQGSLFLCALLYISLT